MSAVQEIHGAILTVPSDIRCQLYPDFDAPFRSLEDKSSDSS